MKKIQNLKIRPNYKAFALALLLGLVGCKRVVYEHKNVFLDMVRDGAKRTILIRDVETGTERIFNSYEYYEYGENYDYLQPGDTVTIVVGGIFSDKAYQNYKVLSSDELTLCYNADSIYNRMERERYAKEREKFNKMKQQLQNDKQK